MERPMAAAEWLAEEDRAARSGRASRLEWLVANSPSADAGFVLHGGWIAKQLLEETKASYVYGQFAAAAVLGVAFMERIFAAQLFAAGRDDLERAPGSDLLRAARAAGWLSEPDFQQFDSVRCLRNPLVHFRRPLTPDSLERRAIEAGDHPEALLEEDARAVLETVLRVMQRLAI